METVFQGVAQLSGDWRAWLVAGLVALKALYAVWCSFRCPVANGLAAPSDAQIEIARANHYAPPPTYLAIMLGGMGLAIGGLYFLHSETYGPLALGALVIGIFMFSTEPNRLSVRNAMMQVFAATGSSEDRLALARERLKIAHRNRALIEAGIAAVVLALLLYM